MLVTLAGLVFIASIICFFSQELIRSFKRVFAIKGAKLILPLATASWLMYSFNDDVLLAAYYYREKIQEGMALLIRAIPFHQGSSFIVPILLLTTVAIVPVTLLNAYCLKKTYRPYPYPYLTSTLIWISCAIWLIIM